MTGDNIFVTTAVSENEEKPRRYDGGVLVVQTKPTGTTNSAMTVATMTPQGMSYAGELDVTALGNWRNNPPQPQ